MSIGTLSTLFAVPSIYVLLARDHRKAHAKDLEAERAVQTATLPREGSPELAA
jgi:hypothetical protein